MDTARAPCIRDLMAADRFNRLRIYSPLTAEGEGIIVHAKVSIFDDDLVCVGSANLNNRSEGFDTECELALQGWDD
jgi:phosphatidylserine/phosphatidylglycerophosphate/cardiolipin synthase-like enzyme